MAHLCRTDGWISGTAACDDGLYCNGLETFVGGSCQWGTPPDCSGLTDQCNDGVCDDVLDACVSQPKTDGLSCDDGDACTTDDTCAAGTCAGSPLSCADGNA